MSDGVRVPPVAPGTRPELADIERSIAAERGAISLLYRVLLHSPLIASGWEKLLTAVRNRTELAPQLRELIILRVAVLNGAPFEFDAHTPHALHAGVTRAQLEAVQRVDCGGMSAAAVAGTFAADERLVLELADAMTRDVTVGDELMERVRARFDARGVVEVVTTVAAYNMVSRFLVALNLVHEA